MSVTSSSPEAPALEVRGIVKRFTGVGRSDTLVALDHIDLSVAHGCVVAIVGSNGAGKSTLLSVISGSTLPDEGNVLIGGRDTTDVPSWRRARTVARVRQNPEHNVFGGLSIEENFALRIAGSQRSFGLRRAAGRKVRDVAAEALIPFGMKLEDRLHVQASTLSGGQRQAVAVAMATLGSPEILLLDEHVAALDPKSGRLVTRETENIVRRLGIATLMVTHDMSHALAESDRLLMMHRGRIVMDLDSAEKQQLDAAGLVQRFEALAGEAMPDRSVLA